MLFSWHSKVMFFQVPAMGVFTKSLELGKFADSRKLSNGKDMQFSKIYPMDAVFDTPDDVPPEVCPELKHRLPTTLSVVQCVHSSQPQNDATFNVKGHGRVEWLGSHPSNSKRCILKVSFDGIVYQF
jgi:hypothetical protein